MIDKLVGIIAEKLMELTDCKYAVYTESVHQGAEKPCFFVECDNITRQSLLGGRFFMRVRVKVTVKNDSDTKRYEVETMAGELFDLLNCIKDDERVFYARGIKANWEKDDFVVECSYDIFMESIKEAPLMEKIEVKG